MIMILYCLIPKYNLPSTHSTISLMTVKRWYRCLQFSAVLTFEA